MNFFNLFGNKRKEDIKSPQQVIQDMKRTLETLEKREKFLEKCIADIKNEVKLYVKTNKQKAISLLKKAKMKEKQLTVIYGQKNNIETQICTLEQGISNKNIINSMRQGKTAITTITQKLNPDDIEELVDDINTAIDDTDEIASAMATPIGQIYDNDDLLEEFEQEIKEEIKEENEQVKNTLVSTTTSSHNETSPLSSDIFPKVPTKPITNKEENNEDDKELAELEQLMFM